MSLYTETLLNYIENGNQLPTAFNQIEGLDEKFLNFYFDREIGFETEIIFKKKLENLANILVPIYKERLEMHTTFIAGVKNPAKTFYEQKTTKIDLGATKSRVRELPFAESSTATLEPAPSSESASDAVTNSTTDELKRDSTFDEKLRVLEKLNQEADSIVLTLLKSFEPLFMQIF